MSADLPSTLTTLGESAFYSCTALTKINIPASVTTLGEYCFSKDTALKQVIFEGNAPEIGEGAFNTVVARVFIPAGDASWTSSVKQNYGGTLTWYSYEVASGHTLNVDQLEHQIELEMEGNDSEMTDTIVVIEEE